MFLKAVLQLCKIVKYSRTSYWTDFEQLSFNAHNGYTTLLINHLYISLSTWHKNTKHIHYNHTLTWAATFLKMFLLFLRDDECGLIYSHHHHHNCTITLFWMKIKTHSPDLRTLDFFAHRTTLNIQTNARTALTSFSRRILEMSIASVWASDGVIPHPNLNDTV